MNLFLKWKKHLQSYLWLRFQMHSHFSRTSSKWLLQIKLWPQLIINSDLLIIRSFQELVSKEELNSTMELHGELYAMISLIKHQLMYSADRLILLGVLSAGLIMQACPKLESKTFLILIACPFWWMTLFALEMKKV